MRKQDLALNLLLLLSLATMGWKLHRDWKAYSSHNGPQSLKTHTIEMISVPPPSEAPDYTAVARMNPFSADRNDLIQEAATQPKPTGPPPLFYGSVIMGEARFALMATEQSPKPERVSEGATFNGYQLVKVLPESIILESAAGRDEIMLYNALMRLHRLQSKTTASTLTSSSNSVRATTVSSSTPNSSAVQTAASVTEPINSPATPVASPDAPVAVPAGKTVVDTPFGPIVTDKKKP